MRVVRVGLDASRPQHRSDGPNQNRIADTCARLYQVSGPAWHTLPSWYAVSGADRVIDPAEQRWMAGRAGSTVVEFDDAGHAGGYTHYAARFVKLIEQAVAATAD